MGKVIINDIYYPIAKLSPKILLLSRWVAVSLAIKFNIFLISAVISTIDLQISLSLGMIKSEI